MNKFTRGLLGLAFGLLASYTAQANLISPIEVTPSDENDNTIISAVSADIAGPGETIVDLLRLDYLAKPVAGSPITVTYGATGTATVSWNLTGTGDELEGVYIFGGDHANIYGVTSDEEISSGSGQIVITPPNNGGQTPAISHILFLGTGSEIFTAPDTASTGLLLGASFFGLSFLRKLITRQK